MASTLAQSLQSVLDELSVGITANGYRSLNLRVLLENPNKFVTGSLTFSENSFRVSDPEIHKYNDATLISVVSDVEMWRDFLVRMLTDNFSLFGTEIPLSLAFSQSQPDTDLNSDISSPRFAYHFDLNNRYYHQTRGTLMAIGRPPYASIEDASARFVHQLKSRTGGILHEGRLVVSLPTKPLIASAEWIPGELRIRFHEGLQPRYQLDILFWTGASVIESQSHSSLGRDFTSAVPKRTTRITAYLIRDDGNVAHSFELRSPYTFVGEKTATLSLEQLVRADIAAGESEIREMKAFFNPDGNTEMKTRVLHTTIAFANTQGGTIYIGVEDNGEFSGTPKLRGVSSKRVPSECAKDISKKLRKLIIENTRPVVEVQANEICLSGDWVIALSVGKSTEVVSTHRNVVVIRAGASNRLPDPKWFEQRKADNSWF
ncbi:putative transcriptional regulator [Candidatus Koribacter versatilis Ellin345]|uniref:Transcriptional regulator n=1 Tax=Koribacter versatilis (strain Ellin345) TaxID=204669 RepID=Q1IR33_KORVE|nr:ATP-binding protein [Candidatus Koribacter versatilis]ABF40667.1 putative transcriptional regulator [Candidatus Koribacter versatilis Ellin345]